VPDIAILDVTMPGVTGPEILSFVNSRESFDATGIFDRI